jgi:hypothetical protein
MYTDGSPSRKLPCGLQNGSPPGIAFVTANMVLLPEMMLGLIKMVLLPKVTLVSDIMVLSPKSAMVSHKNGSLI